MCGIFGVYNQSGKLNRHDRQVLRALALVNRERGVDALGFFDGDGAIVKSAGDALDLLAAGILGKVCGKRHFIAGHTRSSTCGNANADHAAHPFHYGNIVGAHNGTCEAPARYAVDSEFLIDRLSQHMHDESAAGFDYQTALENVSGYWALQLTVRGSSKLVILTHGNSVSIAQRGDAWYWSSDEEHLRAATGCREKFSISGGEGIVFFPGDNEPAMLPQFVSIAPKRSIIKPWPRATAWRNDEYVIDDDIQPAKRGSIYDRLWSGADKMAQEYGYPTLAEYAAAHQISETDAYRQLTTESDRKWFLHD